MNNRNTALIRSERVLIETDEFIFPIRIEQVLYAETTESQIIRFYESDANYQFANKESTIISLLKQAGFIRVNADLYVNPKQISEYKIKDQLVEFSSGRRVAVHPKFKKKLIAYFIQHNLFSD